MGGREVKWDPFKYSEEKLSDEDVHVKYFKDFLQKELLIKFLNFMSFYQTKSLSLMDM